MSANYANTLLIAHFGTILLQERYAWKEPNSHSLKLSRLRGGEELLYVANEASFQAEAKGFVRIRLERCRNVLGSNHYRIPSRYAFAGHGTSCRHFWVRRRFLTSAWRHSTLPVRKKCPITRGPYSTSPEGGADAVTDAADAATDAADSATDADSAADAVSADSAADAADAVADAGASNSDASDSAWVGGAEAAAAAGSADGRRR